MDRKLTKYLLLLAENDDFKTTLHLLLKNHHDDHKQKINLNKTTYSGDYLITLSAYAACEKGGEKERMYALKCFCFLLENDFTAVHKVARDGGNALHCALAAACCCDVDEENNHDDNDEEDDDESDYEEEEEDYDNNDVEIIDQDYIKELKSQVGNDVSHLDNYHPEFNNLSSNAMIVVVIRLLLENDIDINLPLANNNDIYYITNYNNNENGEGESCDEIELSYSKEAIQQQWTPFMFVIQMVLIAETDESRALSCLIFQLFIKYGADLTYMMEKDDWNVLQILMSCSHLLNIRRMNSKIYNYMKFLDILSMTQLEVMGYECKKIFGYAEIGDCLQQHQPITIYDYLCDIVLKCECCYKILPLQKFAAAIMTNDVPLADSILSTERSKDRITLLREWRGSYFSSIFPLCRTAWGKNVESFSAMTILDLASYCHAFDSIKFLIGHDFESLSEQEMRNTIQYVFMNDYIHKDCGKVTADQISTLHILLGMNQKDSSYNDIFLAKRQQVLDMLLMESCTKVAWAQQSTESTLILLLLGADPNVKSLKDKMLKKISPLHLVAGNYRGKDGVKKVDYLLGKTDKIEYLSAKNSIICADLYSRTDTSSLTPLQLALEKKNFHVVKHLYDTIYGTSCPIGDAEIDWTIEHAFSLGEAAIECTSINLFQKAIDIMKRCSLLSDGDHDNKLGKYLGKLLLWAVDERSAFGNKRSSEIEQKNGEKLKEAVHIIHDVQTVISGLDIGAWSRDEISGQTPLHLLLRNDRTARLRILLLRPLCEILSKGDKYDNICLQCSDKYGSYTALHLACALGCEDSVKILLEFHSDPSMLTIDNEYAVDMIPKHVIFSEKLMFQLNRN